MQKTSVSEGLFDQPIGTQFYKVAKQRVSESKNPLNCASACDTSDSLFPSIETREPIRKADIRMHRMRMDFSDT